MVIQEHLFSSYKDILSCKIDRIQHAEGKTDYRRMKRNQTPITGNITSEYNKGFSLVELLVVIAIIGTLAAIAVPLFSSYVDRTRIAKVKADIRTIEKDVNSFAIEKGRYPVDLSEIGMASLKDCWGNPYQYLLV